VKILDKNKNTVLAENAVIAATFFTRMRGLLGRKGLEAGQAMVIKSCTSVHTFFMQFTIDVVFVDKNNRVVKTISNLRPWRFTPFYPAASYCIEFPAGTISARSITSGTEVALS
jgi:uncharacterized protein